MIDKFVEIEIEINPANTHTIPNKAIPTSIYNDPIRTKFYDMRDLANNKNHWLGNSAFNDDKLFYKQAKFMENFNDNYEKTVELYMDTPCYQRMGYEQLRTYFTWRTKVRHGQIESISKPYLLLYIYELLSGIGVDNPVEGLEKLMTLWKTFIDKNEYDFDKELPQWIMDYHIYYPLPHSFEEFICEHNLQKYYSPAFHSSNMSDFESWDKLSNYHIESSIFCKENPENTKRIKDCFLLAVNAIRELCNSKNTSINNLLYYKRDWMIEWSPFRLALFYPWLKQPEHSITLADGSTYFYKNNKWQQQVVVPYENYKSIVAYFIKKTESCVRQHAKFKRKFTVDNTKFLTPEYAMHLIKLNIELQEINKAIETAVLQYFKSLSHIEVKVNLQNLERIRIDAKTTQDSLIVDDNENDNENQVETLNDAPVSTNESRDNVNVELPSPPTPLEDKESLHHTSDTQLEKDSWVQLNEALTAIEKQAVTILLNGENLALFASENNIMVEVLIDNINEKASDCIGDSIIDDSMEIYDDYKNLIVRA